MQAGQMEVNLPLRGIAYSGLETIRAQTFRWGIGASAIGSKMERVVLPPPAHWNPCLCIVHALDEGAGYEAQGVFVFTMR